MTRILALWAVTVCCCIPPCGGQDEADLLQPLPLGVDRDRIRIDAIVSDASGRPVVDLKSDDISVNYVAPDEHLQVNLVSDDQPRDTIFLINDPGMSLAQFIEVQRALRHFVENGIKPGQLVSILHFARSSGYSAALTHDRSRLNEAIDEMCWRPVQYSGDLFLYFIQNVLLQVQQYSGRKNVIVLDTSHHTFALNALHLAADEALRAAATVHFIAVDKVVTALDLPRTVPTGGDESKAGHANSQGGSDAHFRHPTDLSWIAGASAGLQFNDGDLGEDFRRCAHAGDIYYLLTWAPAVEAFVKPSSEPGYRPISVRVRRRGVNVRSRDGFLPHSGLSNPRSGTTPQRRMLEATLLPLTGSDLRLSVESSLQYSLKRGIYILTRIYVPRSSLSEPGGCEPDRFELVKESVTQEASKVGVPVISLRPPSESSPNSPFWSPPRRSPAQTTASPFLGQLFELRRCDEQGHPLQAQGILVQSAEAASRGTVRLHFGLRRLSERSEVSTSLPPSRPDRPAARSLINRGPVERGGDAGFISDTFGSGSSLSEIPEEGSKAFIITDPVFSGAALEDQPNYIFRAATEADQVPSVFHPGSDVTYSAVMICHRRVSGKLKLQSIVVHRDTIIYSQTVDIPARAVLKRFRISGTFHVPENAAAGSYLLGLSALGPAADNVRSGWMDFAVHVN